MWKIVGVPKLMWYNLRKSTKGKRFRFYSIIDIFARDTIANSKKWLRLLMTHL